MCDLDPKVKVIGKKAGICDGVPSTAALVLYGGTPTCWQRGLWDSCFQNPTESSVNKSFKNQQHNHVLVEK